MLSNLQKEKVMNRGRGYMCVSITSHLYVRFPLQGMASLLLVSSLLPPLRNFHC